MFSQSKKANSKYSIQPEVVNNYTLAVNLKNLRDSEKVKEQFEKAKQLAKKKIHLPEAR
ncbi:hypothetical protein [Marinomonas sp. GJ51-6]|uniref:hypothetical protein n=1 Tax=Marinomonas sp. GJ51-6 TaxID=2992802 RepID=UPI00293450B6|nr:hypothetical protein [Marinomonas sp. GJ51-6]WOD08323.1 hypothetical protein ONZ50_04130 [Marinomonas sp. GJ51-6]